MVCLSGYNIEILLKNATPEKCENAVKKHSEDVYLVPGGYDIKSIFLLGTDIPVGFSGKTLYFNLQFPGNYRTYYAKKGRFKSEILNMEDIHWKILSLMGEKYENIYL